MVNTSDFSGSELRYTALTVNVITDGTVIISIPMDAALGPDGRGNAASDEYIVTVVGITPNVTEVSADVPADGDGVHITNEIIDITVSI